MNVYLNKTSIFAALRNPVYRKLWFAILLSGTCVAAQDTGGHLDDEHARFLDISAVSDLNSCVPALFPIYSAGRGFGGHG
jgi:hypothetical protein